jgi:hypothetical protein
MMINSENDTLFAKHVKMASQVLQVFDKEWKTARPEAGGR